MNSSAVEKSLEVFISYSHKDEELKEELEVHLANLVRQGKIKPWQDRDIEAGTQWDDQIKQAMAAADIILLLISPRFMASNYINDVELTHALDRDRKGTARVIPIILKPTDFKGTLIERLQALPKDAKPITRWDDQDEAFVNVVSGIRRVVDSLNQSRPTTERAIASATPLETTTQPGATAPTASQTQKRLALFQLLAGLPGPTFDTIVYALNVPPSVMPSAMAAQGQRVSALLQWAESPVGCGLDELESVVRQVVNP